MLSLVFRLLSGSSRPFVHDADDVASLSIDHSRALVLNHSLHAHVCQVASPRHVGFQHTHLNCDVFMWTTRHIQLLITVHGTGLLLHTGSCPLLMKTRIVVDRRVPALHDRRSLPALLQAHPCWDGHAAASSHGLLVVVLDASHILLTPAWSMARMKAL